MDGGGHEAAVIFDFDGVLVDSEGLHFRSLRQSLETVGIGITEAEYLEHYLAFRDRESIALAFLRHGREPDPEGVERVALGKARLFEAGLPGVPLFPGAREVVLALSASYPLAVASGARRREIEAGLARGGLGGAFRAVVAAEDVASGKPSPEPYLLALERLRAGGAPVRAAGCIAVEDSPPGVASAKAAGMKAVAVTHSYPAPALREADLIVPVIGALLNGGLDPLLPTP